MSTHPLVLVPLATSFIPTSLNVNQINQIAALAGLKSFNALVSSS